MMLKCCGKPLKPKKSRKGVFVCEKCGCIFRLVVTRKCPKCSAKGLSMVPVKKKKRRKKR